MTVDLLDANGAFVPNTDPFAAEITSNDQLFIAFLERQRQSFAWKVGGLTTVQLRIRHEPSELTLAGMLNHLARFEDDMATEFVLGLPQLEPWNQVDWEADINWDWRQALEEDASTLYVRWSTSVRRSRDIMTKALETDVSARPIRYVYLNMIEEYARHNGQIDLIRESIDGLVGLDPPYREE